MTEEELEKKAEEWFAKLKEKKIPFSIANTNYCIKQAFKDGYKQGQEDFDSKVTKLLNSYGVKFIDTNSIGGLIALHQLMLELEQENEELKKAITEKNSELEELKTQIEKMKCCGNCKHHEEYDDDSYEIGLEHCHNCDRHSEAEQGVFEDEWELA